MGKKYPTVVRETIYVLDDDELAAQARIVQHLNHHWAIDQQRHGIRFIPTGQLISVPTFTQIMWGIPAPCLGTGANIAGWWIQHPDSRIWKGENLGHPPRSLGTWLRACMELAEAEREGE